MGVGGDQDGRGIRSSAQLLPQIHQKKPHLYVERFAQNIYYTLAEDLGFPKRARDPPCNWVEQKKKERERNNRTIRNVVARVMRC